MPGKPGLRPSRLKLAAGGAPERIDVAYVFSPTGYSNPALFTAIYNGRLTEASPGPMALYLSAFLQQFSNTDGCRDIISKSAQLGLGQHASMNALGQLFGAMANAPNYSAAGPVAGGLASGYEAGSKLNKNLAGVVDRAHDDALLLYTRHGCGSAVARRFFGNVEAYGLALGNPSLMKELERNGAIKTPE